MTATPLNLLTLQSHGAYRFANVLAQSDIASLRDMAHGAGRIRTGKRIYEADDFLFQLLNVDGAVGKIASQALSPTAKPVRVLIFDKTPGSNWSVAWHQDRAIAVQERLDTPGFGPWSVKDGVQHAAPPIEVLARMITIRVHLDDCDDDNSPLLIALGSHKLGKVGARAAAGAAAAHEVMACHAYAGDAWVYSTPILHASEAAKSPNRRRVLQVDYADFDLPSGLRWFGLS